MNVLWGFFNLAAAYVLVIRVGSFSLYDIPQVVALSAGFLLLSVMHARHFGQFHGGLLG